MKEINAVPNRIQYVGYQGDHRRYLVRFDLSDLTEEYPEGDFTLVIRRPGETVWRVSGRTQMDGTDLLWMVESRDLKAAGTIRAQVVCRENYEIAKDDIYKFKVRRAVDGSGSFISEEMAFYIDDAGDLVYSVVGDLDVDFMLSENGDLFTNAQEGYHIDDNGDMIEE